MKLEFHPEADVELVEAAVYYDIEVPGLGRRLETEVRRAMDLLLEQPQLGSPVDRDLRRLVLPHFPFSIIYAASGEFLYVVAVAHHKRRPGYWRSRI